MEQKLFSLTKVKTAIQFFATNTRKTAKSKQGKGFFEARKVLLESYWQKYCNLYEELSSNAENKAGAVESELSSDSFAETEITYTETMGELNDAMHNLTTVDNASTSNLSSNLQSVPPTIIQTQTSVMPRISIPPFDGNFLHWFSFKDLFESIVTNNPALSNTQRLQYLKDSLAGEAKHALDNITTTDSNFSVAWELLKGKYENTRIIINAHIAEILNLPAMQRETASTLRSFCDNLTSSLRALEHLGRPVQHWDDWLIFTVVHKLDGVTRKAWELSLSTSNDLPTFEQLKQFLQSRTSSLEIVQTYNESKSTKHSDFSKTKPATVNNYYTTPHQCLLCKDKHFILFCAHFKNKTAHQRLEIIKKHNLCRNCLRQGHLSRSCPSQHRCHTCNEAHHSMLHDCFIPKPNTAEKNMNYEHQQMSSYNATVSNSNCSTNVALPHVLVGTAVVEVKSSNGAKMILRVLIDSGAESTFISEYTVQQLRLQKEPVTVQINGAAGARIATAKGVTTVTLKSLQDDFELRCTALVIPKIGNLTPANAISINNIKQFSHLRLADPNLHIPGSIDVILSAGDYAAILLNDVKRSSDNKLIAQNTRFGYVVFGSLTSHELKCEQSINCLNTRIDVDEALRKFWEIENLSSEASKILTREDQFCEKLFEETTARHHDGHYIVRLPIKETANLTQLKSSKQDALLSLRHMQNRLNRNEQLRSLYLNFLKEYQDLGHMEIVNNEEDDPEKVCYLPHHGIYKDSSASTKLRVVFNGAKRNDAGLSLNDCLYIGPKLQNDLWTIVLKWRQHKVAITADIAKMYRQIWVDKQDTDLLRILWKNDTSEQPVTYRLLTVTYGTNCAPYLAIKVLHSLAKSEESNYPIAAAIVLNDFYVDDVLSGGDTEDEVTTNRIELQNLLQSAGFKLHKFHSNSCDVLQKIAPSDRDQADTYNLDMEEKTKVLGIGWVPETDELCFKLSLDYTKQHVSKRQLLSEIAKLFDPLGLLAPIIIRGKIFLQQLWLTGLQWDDLLPDELLKKWKTFRHELQQLNSLRIPRWIGVRKLHQRYELHIFADASSTAYAAVAYLRIVSDENIYTTLLTAKTKVAPLKKLTIPRLELCAAVLGTRLMQKVKEALTIDMNSTILWSDSNTVLCWIRTDPGKLKEFVANRVMEIQQYTTASEWRYVPSVDNPADQASKGLPVHQFLTQNLWWRGPHWLMFNETDWPRMPELEITSIPEVKTKKLFMTMKEPLSFEKQLLEQYSNLDKLLAVGAWCKRFINNIQSPQKITSKIVSWPERKAILNQLIIYVQQKNFRDELKSIQKGEAISKKSKIWKLHPVEDGDGILRLGGRLINANMSMNEKHPVILPKTNALSTLIIAHAHEKTLHGGVQVTLQYVRQKYWLIDGRTSVKKYIRTCVRCFRQTCEPATQLMGNLPPARCNPALPFLNTGVDYAGPFHIRTTKGRGYRSYKGYVALFICLATRAIHLELVSDMTADSFIAALKRFTSCRGICANLYSDRGTNFVGADTLLKSELQLFNAQLQAASFYTAKCGIQWHFIPPAAPNFGGIWEAGVKSMKYHLRRSVNNATLTFEEFYTLLKQIEACLNSRPLTVATDDPTDLNPLTPSHFLIGRPILTVPEASVLDAKQKLTNRWKLLRQMQQTFWRRWSLEYLQQLQTRTKWRNTQKNIKVGQIVLVRDDNAPPARWLLGRITAVHPGSDGLVRVVTVKTVSSEIKRPISKISPLPTDDYYRVEDNVCQANTAVDLVPDGGRPVQ